MVLPSASVHPPCLVADLVAVIAMLMPSMAACVVTVECVFALFEDAQGDA